MDIIMIQTLKTIVCTVYSYADSLITKGICG